MELKNPNIEQNTKKSQTFFCTVIGQKKISMLIVIEKKVYSKYLDKNHILTFSLIGSSVVFDASESALEDVVPFCSFFLLRSNEQKLC